MDKTTSTQLANAGSIRYMDDKIKTYETQVTRWISEMMVGYDDMNEAVYSLSYKECSCVEPKNIGYKMMIDFRNVVGGEHADDGKIELIDKFERYRGTNKQTELIHTRRRQWCT